MSLRIVPYYAAVLALIFVFLSIQVIRLRGSAKLVLGTAGNERLERRVRVHGNFAEYTPFALLLLAMAEVRGTGPIRLHLLCAVLLVGRLTHAWGVSRSPEDLRLRVAGMGATFAALVGSALAILFG